MSDVVISGKKKLKDIEGRYFKITKSNTLIQKSGFELSAQEQKIMLYLISKIKPDDNVFITSDFDITEFCKVCGTDITSGKNHKDIESALTILASKVLWVKLTNGEKTIIRWIDKPYLNEQTGKMRIKFDDLLKPYLLQLKNNFTQFELVYTLAMKSRYSIRLYEILRSYEYKHTIIEFELDTLKELLSATVYNRYQDFRRKVLEVATNEINDLSDIHAAYELIKDGRKYSKIQFIITLKQDMDDRFETWKRIKNVIGD